MRDLLACPALRPRACPRRVAGRNLYLVRASRHQSCRGHYIVRAGCAIRRCLRSRRTCSRASPRNSAGRRSRKSRVPCLPSHVGNSALSGHKPEP